MITLKAIKKKIQKNKIKQIWYSSRTGWWTHSLKDVTAAAEMVQSKMIETLEARRKASTDLVQRSMLAKQIEEISKKLPPVPVDPSGAPLYVSDNPKKFIGLAESHPENYGKRGLAAFIQAHHRNCNGMCFENFDLYIQEQHEN